MKSMDPFNPPGSSIPSNRRSGTTAPFAYQARLLDPTLSRANSASRSRSNSSNISVLSDSTGSSSGTTPSPRRWTPTHRTGASLDTIRGKWEERAREALQDGPSASPTKDSSSSRPFPSPSSSIDSPVTAPLFSDRQSTGSDSGDDKPTPKYLKRRTMPAPIIASPLSPNNTGVSVEADSPALATTHRIRIPNDAPKAPSWVPEVYTASPTKPKRFSGSQLSGAPLQRAKTVDLATDLGGSAPTKLKETTTAPAARSLVEVNTSDYNRFRTLSKASAPSPPPVVLHARSSSATTTTSSVMFPAPYRSSASSKKDAYGALSAGTPLRRLGNHLPRIASGDGEDSMTEEPKTVRSRPLSPALASPARDVQAEKEAQILAKTQMNNADAVAGLPGRLQLKAPSSVPLQPPASIAYYRTSWADKQRHSIQAYEYLCHVGEAQQWIEGCLGEELDCGVVELEETLRNGVVLAKLVRAFKGEGAVKRIYEAPKLEYRHSDNINVFADFLKEVGLPESFIFELTDLYNKKNLPKVIYCIHALSHLMARRGMAQRIGNLVGQLEFSDDQLQRAQKGLKDAGVAMPNFGNVGRELAKEINEPEPEETEEEKREKELFAAQDSIVTLQAQLRGYLLRKSIHALRSRLRLGERSIRKLQAHLAGVLVRRYMRSMRRGYLTMNSWAVHLQARARGILLRRKWNAFLNRLVAAEDYVVLIQAQLRGVLQRQAFARLKMALRKFNFSTKKLQSAARGHLLRHTQQELKKTFTVNTVSFSVVGFQAHCRGALERRRLRRRMEILRALSKKFVGLQARCRGVLMRRRFRSQMAKLEDVTHVVVSIQSAARTYLARKRLLALIRGLRRATRSITSFQTMARATLVRQKQEQLKKALMDVKSLRSVGKLQALAKASLVRKEHRELDKKLEISLPDVVGFQAAARGALLRDDFYAWRDHLHRNHDVATYLQALFRGVMQRNAFQAKLDYYQANLRKVVKIQSLFRAKETREQYRALTLGQNVSISTIKNFVHLLDDSEADFQEEVKVERLRQRVVERIRENQALETEVHDLDTQIGLYVDNLKSLEEAMKARKNGTEGPSFAQRTSLLAAHGDPFSGPHTLDHDARKKLDLYQQLLYLLQTRQEYIVQLLFLFSKDEVSEVNRRFVDRVVLMLYGYGQSHREEYLLIKFFQLAIKQEVRSAAALDDLVTAHPVYINVASHYIRPRHLNYARETFQAIVLELINADDCDLESDPCLIHRQRIEVEEIRSGRLSDEKKDVSFREAVVDLKTRPIYIRHMQTLQWWTEAFIKAIIRSTRKMPYAMRYLLRETLLSLRETFPDFPPEYHAICVGKLVFYHFINPVLMSPESFDLVAKNVNATTLKKNLAQISNVFSQIVSGGEIDDTKPYLVPIEEFIHQATGQMASWFIELADVPDAEAQFHAHEFLDATVQPKAVYISPNEIYTLHSLLQTHQDQIAHGSDDTLKIILAELGGVPHLNNELKEARDVAISLELTNRFAHIQDPHAEEKTLWVQAKRSVLAILRVQPDQDLEASLLRPVSEADEQLWEEILDAEIENEMRQMPRRQPSAAANDSAYRLEDIRSLNFVAVKKLALSAILELEEQGKITRADKFQGILNAIAGDVRSKHRKRLQRQKEMAEMNEVLRQLAERKKHFEEQINSYHAFVEGSMNTMMQKGKGKRRFFRPFSMQFFHIRDVQKTGPAPQFGSFIYSAKDLYDRGVLLSIDQHSPRQYNKFQLIMSSDRAGIFNITLNSNLYGVSARVATEDIKMEDLLKAKYERRPSLALFGGKVKVNFERFLFQVNKKFYA